MLKQGLERLAGRRPVVDEIPMPFCSDAVGILGVALGTRSLADSSVSAKIVSWLSSFLPTIYDLDGTENWQRCLFQAADHVLGGGIELPPWLARPKMSMALCAKTFFPASGKRQSRKRKEH